MKILDGKKLAELTLEKIEQEIRDLKTKPILSIVLCGDNPASLVYVKSKIKKAQQVGIKTRLCKLPETASENQIINLVKSLNNKSDGIIVQLPLPKHLDACKIIRTIDPKKDVDGLTPLNLGKTLENKEYFVPATPKGIIKILEYYEISIKGKDVVIINHSNLLGRPLAAMMLNRNASVSICHEFTKDLSEYTKKADIIITGVGKPKLLKKDMIKKNSVIIDAGISKINNKIYGDVDFENIRGKVKAITPVPGGVGPMTVAMLLENVLISFKRNN
jgi:methylenetetrahydrofolate dehydrogenase (NADP+)/methenyltetrahydrofolate cyclohydrolase